MLFLYVCLSLILVRIYLYVVCRNDCENIHHWNIMSDHTKMTMAEAVPKEYTQSTSNKNCMVQCIRRGYTQSVVQCFQQSLSSKDFVDVTICCQGRSVRAHRLLLAGCSNYLRDILLQAPSKHPTIILHDVHHRDVTALVDLLYFGKVEMPAKYWVGFCHTAKTLGVSVDIKTVENPAGMKETSMASPSPETNHGIPDFLINTPSNPDSIKFATICKPPERAPIQNSMIIADTALISKVKPNQTGLFGDLLPSLPQKQLPQNYASNQFVHTPEERSEKAMINQRSTQCDTSIQSSYYSNVSGNTSTRYTRTICYAAKHNTSLRQLPEWTKESIRARAQIHHPHMNSSAVTNPIKSNCKEGPKMPYVRDYLPYKEHLQSVPPSAAVPVPQWADSVRMNDNIQLNGLSVQQRKPSTAKANETFVITDRAENVPSCWNGHLAQEQLYPRFYTKKHHGLAQSITNESDLPNFRVNKRCLNQVHTRTNPHNTQISEIVSSNSQSPTGLLEFKSENSNSSEVSCTGMSPTAVVPELGYPSPAVSATAKFGNVEWLSTTFSSSQSKTSTGMAKSAPMDLSIREDSTDYDIKYNNSYVGSPAATQGSDTIMFMSSLSPQNNDQINKSHTSETCGKYFSEKAHCTAHIQTHTEKKLYTCDVCQKKFVSKTSVKTHQRTHSEEKPYSCKQCNKGFSQLRNYRYHQSLHEGTKEFACSCPICGKCFNDRGYLSSHLKIHRNQKEYKCNYCDKSFNQRVAYNMHVRIHTGEKPHKCTECDKSFSRKMLLKQHIRIHTGERPYSCYACDKTFADRSNMMIHQRLHTGVKPYTCEQCGKSFTKNHHLKTHINYHTGIKPYECKQCGMKFSQSSNMRTHFRKCLIRRQTNADMNINTAIVVQMATGQ